MVDDSTIKTTPQHKIAVQDIAALLRKHSENMDAIEILALASNLVGKILAFQDRRVVAIDYAMEVVQHNIELGNREALEFFLSSGGNPLKPN